MTIYFGSSTDEDLIAELEQRGYFCAKAQEPGVEAYEFCNSEKICSRWCGNSSCVSHYANPIPPVLEPDWLLETTKELAKAIHRDNYPDVPQWEVLDDLPGVISQIDNMVCGMERKTPVREPLSDNTIAALRQAIVQPARQVPTTNYVQPVPDHCDRITWRNRYYHLPLAAALPYGPRPKFGAIGSRDVDVAEAQRAWDKAMAAQPAQVPAGSIRLWDTQWASIVNHDNAYNGWSTNDAVNHAVRMTERYIAANVAQNNLPPLPAAPEVK